MVEKLIDILKVFFEKYFISALVAVIPTAIVMYVTPENFKILTKIGKNFYVFVIFSIFFLTIRFIIFLYKKIDNNIYYAKQKKEHNANLEKENIEFIFDLVDSLSPENRKILKYFLENDNKPIIVSGCLFGNELLDVYCNKIKCEVDEEVIESVDLFNLKKMIKFNKGTLVTKYKLKEELFNSMKYVEKKYGKISRF